MAPGGWEAARTNGSAPLGGGEMMWWRQVARRERVAQKRRWEAAETARRKGKLRLGLGEARACPKWHGRGLYKEGGLGIRFLGLSELSDRDRAVPDARRGRLGLEDWT